MNCTRFTLTGVGALAAVVVLWGLQAVGQNPVPVPTTPRILYQEETFDKVLPDGKVERITVKVPVQENVVVQSGAGDYRPQPALATANVDPEAYKLWAAEQAAAQEARTLSQQSQHGESDGAKAEAKQKLREKLVEIFDLQQQRRTREIAKIEERLGKLKDVLKKRDTAKDSIVDRRLESLTGGVDELGWEESLAPQFNRTNSVPQPYGLPTVQPRGGFVPNTIEPAAGPVAAPPPSDVPPRLSLPEPVPVLPSVSPPGGVPLTTPPPVAPVPAAPTASRR